MIAETYDGQTETQIVTALVVSKETLARLAHHWTDDPFRSKWSNEIGQWCIDYYIKHQDAPKVSIVQLFKQWCEKNQDPDERKLMERFLTSLNRKYESLAGELNSSFMIELATKHFNEVRLERIAEDVTARLQRGDVDGAITAAEDFRRVKLATPNYVDVFRDIEAQRLALEEQQRVLIRYEGGIGEFFGDELSEDSFIAFLAPMKVGKSFLMLDLAWTAVRQKRRVAYFQIGDLTKGQIMRRFQKRAARRPLKRCVIQYPVSLVGTDDDIAQVAHEDRVFDFSITSEEGLKAYEKIVSKHKKQRLRLSCHPSKTVNVNDIRSILEEWDRGGWVANVVIIDYADNLLPNNSKMADHKQVEDTWQYLRQLSEIRKCLVVTATQVNKEGFDTWVMTKKNFSGSKMIMATVTGFVGINQTNEEREKQLWRLNWIVRREDKFSEYKCCHVASALGMAQGVVLSYF